MVQNQTPEETSEEETPGAEQAPEKGATWDLSEMETSRTKAEEIKARAQREDHNHNGPPNSAARYGL